MSIHHAFLVIASFLSIGSAASAAEPVIVPTLVCRGYFLVPITLAARDGYAADRTLWFLHDTGASTSYVDPDSIARITGNRPGARDRVNINDAQSGAVAINHLQARVSQLDHLARALGHPIDGILSFGAFSDFLLTLDYEHDEMRLDEGRLPRPDGVTVFDADGPDYRPWMVVEFPDRRRRMLIDSGAAMTSLAVRRIDLYDTVEPPRPTGASMRLREVEERSGARSSLNARIGPNRLIAPTLQSTPGTELIGGEVMRHFTWTFDQSTERVRMVRNHPEIPITFEPDFDHGMVFEPHPLGYRVGAVIANTPASRAGVQVGDIVTGFNGRSLDVRGCDGPPPDNRLVVSLIRNGEPMSLTLELFALVE
ncbi:PDZ domain-containing protein [uncultured Maricaulis sp.]|uniref:PDZ domain-containing protein n=1 Tax=uncultured Maricaulis sp. TaxID=174710 RepID=UPI0030D9431C